MVNTRSWGQKLNIVIFDLHGEGEARKVRGGGPGDPAGSAAIGAAPVVPPPSPHSSPPRDIRHALSPLLRLRPLAMSVDPSILGCHRVGCQGRSRSRARGERTGGKEGALARRPDVGGTAGGRGGCQTAKVGAGGWRRRGLANFLYIYFFDF